MSAFSPVIITDGTTPVTLNPDRKAGNIFDYTQVEKTALEAMSLRQIQTISKSNRKQYVRLVQPQTATDTDTGSVVVVGEPLYATIELQIPSDVDSATRAAFVKKALDLGSASALEGALVDGENTW